MSEPTPPADALDLVSRRFWHEMTLDEVMAGAEPLTPDEALGISDLTDDEWTAFTKALRE